MLGAIVLQVVLIALNAIFASAEGAMISMKQSKLEKLADDGDKRARRLLKLVSNPSRFLSTIQVAITLAALLGSAYAADNFSEPIVTWLTEIGVKVSPSVLENVSVFAITIILSYFSIVFGELIPKRAAMKNPEKVSFGLSGLLRGVSVIFAPFVWILTKSTNGILRLMGINPDENDENVTEEEIRLMLDTGSERGTIDSLENEMIQNIFEFDDISVSEVCTHRRDVNFLYRDDDISEWKDWVTRSRHTYYPICGDNDDDVIGILNIRKFFRAECKDTASALRVATEKPFFVPSSMKADVLFNQMKEKRIYFAVVIDEYGGTQGVITIHDLLELLVGTLGDRDEAAVEEISEIGENEWSVIGSASLTDVSKALGVEIESEDYDTFGGYILSLYGSIPEDGSAFDIETEALKIHVSSVEDHRIEGTVVSLKHYDGSADGDRE